MLAWKSDCLRGERWIREFPGAVSFSKQHFLPFSTCLPVWVVHLQISLSDTFFNLQEQKTTFFPLWF